MLNLLHGLKVLDLSRVISGPFCSRMLADLGAEVIKVESPNGDRVRQSPPMKGDYSSIFSQFNAGKKSLCVDYRKKEGIELIQRLVPHVEVVLENFRAGQLDEMGLGYETLRQLNPRIICCSISGFGQTGPEAGRPAYTDIIQALAGYDYAAQNIPEYEGDGPPGVPVSLADTCASLNACVSILAALYHRELTGHGQYIDLSMFDALVAANDTTLQRCAFTDGAEGAPSMIFRPPFKVKDGYLAASVGLNVEKTAQMIGLPELLEDERFSTQAAQREHMLEFVDLVRFWASERTLAEACRAFEAHDIPYGKVQSSQEIIESDLVRARQMLVEMDLPGTGKLPILNTPFNFSSGRSNPQGPPPRLGEHNQAVLVSLIGLSDGEYRALVKEGVLVSTPASAETDGVTP